MTRIHIAGDAGGYAIARFLEDRGRSSGLEVIWHGTDEVDPGDDYPGYAVRVGQLVIEDQDAGIDAFGVLVFEDPEAGAIAANKVNGVRAVHTTSARRAGELREVADANVVVLGGTAHDETAWLIVYAFVTAKLSHSVDRGRRVLQIAEFENAGTIEGWAVQLEPEQIHRSYEEEQYEPRSTV